MKYIEDENGQLRFEDFQIKKERNNMSNFNYYNSETGESFSACIGDDAKIGGALYYVDYESSDFLNWTSVTTFDDIIDAYNSGETIIARIEANGQNENGTIFDNVTALFNISKITPEKIEFTNTDFDNGYLNTIKITHTLNNEITVNSLTVH